MILKIRRWYFCMAQELKSKVAVIGGGPAGCACAYFLKQGGILPVVFEKTSPLKTLLPTGGGRCNLAHAEFDLRELASNYPRGEKFLYSVFSRFGTSETLEMFEKMGVKTYIQDDMRIFPTSNSSADVRKAFLNALSGVKFQKDNVMSVKVCSGGFDVKCEKSSYFFEKVVIAIGGHSAFSIAENLGHNVIPPRPALTALKTNEDLSSLAGVSVKNVRAEFANSILTGDLLFTHNGVSGPVVYQISSIMARAQMPYKVVFDFTSGIDFQELLNSNPHKAVKNVLSEVVPKSLAEFTLNKCGVDENLEACKVDGKIRDKILAKLAGFQIEAVSTAKGGEVVMSGGVALDEVNSKTMESKLVPDLYFCGEVLDIDGFCGGFNLQNCWSTGFLAAQGILAKY